MSTSACEFLNGTTLTQPVMPLEQRGVNFYVHGTETPWKLQGVTAFDAQQRALNGEWDHLKRYLSFTQSIGANTWVVFGCWSEINLRYQDYELGYYFNVAHGLAEFLKAGGTRLYWCTFTDQQEGKPTRLSQQTRNLVMRYSLDLTIMYEGLLECNNEDWQNGEIAHLFPASSFYGALACRSAFQDGFSYTQPGSLLSFTNEHSPRDPQWMRKFKNGYETSVQGLGDLAPASGHPSLLREPVGIASVDEPGRRSADPRAHMEYHGGAVLFTAGSCLHGDLRDLQRTIAPVDTALLCAKSVGNAWRFGLPKLANERARYSRGGPDAPFPIAVVHRDDLALRTFEMRLSEQETWIEVVQPKPGWELKPVDGWRPLDSYGNCFYHLGR